MDELLEIKELLESAIELKQHKGGKMTQYSLGILDGYKKVLDVVNEMIDERKQKDDIKQRN